MKLLLKILSLISLVPGLALLALGLSRYRLPYENGRYFDAEQGVVYHLEAAHVYTIMGIGLTLVGIVVALACFRVVRARRVPGVAELRPPLT